MAATHPDVAEAAAARPTREICDSRNITTLPEALRVFFSKPGPRMIAATALVGWTGRAFFGPPLPGDFAIWGAVMTYWPFQEWLVHRHLLHLKPKVRDGKTTFDLHFARKHRAHHRDPRDIDLTLLPKRIVERALAADVTLWLLLSPLKRHAFTGIAATASMMLFYEWTHFIVHTGVQPKTKLGRVVRRNHLLHHFHNEHYWLGFTVPWVDQALGTAPDRGSVPKSATAKNLHGLDEDELS